MASINNIKSNVDLNENNNIDQELERYKKQIEELRIIKEIKNFKICRCIFNNRYLCLSNGIIFDTLRNNKLIPTINPITGYSAVWLNININNENIKKFLYVHHIIYFSFNKIKKLPDKFNIDHINSIRNDNRLENLQLLTHKENINKSKENKDTRYKEIDKKAYSKIKQKRILKQQLIKLNEEIKILNDIVF